MMENNQYLQSIVDEMRENSEITQENIIDEINAQSTLTGKCILARKYSGPQSTVTEEMCKRDLGIGPPLNETSGDGRKNGINYEIKVSIHAKKSAINFVQIRPQHDVQIYIFVTYNMYENELLGNAHIFTVPSHAVYDMVIKYGGYAHGTKCVNGSITKENFGIDNREYALRCKDPNAKTGKCAQLWNELLNYEVEYHSDKF